MLPLRDFSGGLNTNDSPENIAYNEVQDCENVFFDVIPKGIVKRGGKQTLYDLAGSATAVMREYEYIKNDGTIILLVQYNDGVIKYTFDKQTWTTLITLTADTMCDFATFEGMLWITNGVDNVVMWDGEETDKEGGD